MLTSHTIFVSNFRQIWRAIPRKMFYQIKKFTVEIWIPDLSHISKVLRCLIWNIQNAVWKLDQLVWPSNDHMTKLMLNVKNIGKWTQNAQITHKPDPRLLLNGLTNHTNKMATKKSVFG